MQSAPLQDIELMPQTKISASSRRRDLKQSHSMQTKRKAIAIMRRSCSDSLLAASQMDGVFGSDSLKKK
jgi:hypothetical protein